MCTIVREGESVSVSGERERITEHRREQQSRAEHAAAAEHAARSRADHAARSRAESSSSRAEHRSSDGIQEARTLRVQVGLNPNCTEYSFFG